MSTIFLRRGFLLAAIVPALLTAGCGGSGQAMKGAASPVPPTSTDTGMYSESPMDSGSPTGTDTAGPSPTGTGAAQAPRGALLKFYAALAAGNVDKVVSYFASDAVVAVEDEPTAQGTQAIRTLIQEKPDLGTGKPTIDESEVMGKYAFVRATVGQNDEAVRAFIVLVQANGDWKIGRMMTNSP